MTAELWIERNSLHKRARHQNKLSQPRNICIEMINTKYKVKPAFALWTETSRPLHFPVSLFTAVIEQM